MSKRQFEWETEWDNMKSNKRVKDSDAEVVRSAASTIRLNTLMSIRASGLGEAGPNLSCAEILATLLFSKDAGMTVDGSNAGLPSNDRLVLAKNSASTAYQAAWSLAGVVGESELMGVGSLGCRLEGTPTEKVPFVSAPTGLGDGLGFACGMALANRNAFKNSAKIYCLADVEDVHSGSFQEAMTFAGDNKLSNLILIVEQPMEGSMHDDHFRSHGWSVISVNGHEIAQLQAALKMSQNNDGPTVICAKTSGGLDLADDKMLDREIESLVRSNSPDSQLCLNAPGNESSNYQLAYRGQSKLSRPSQRIGDKVSCMFQEVADALIDVSDADNQFQPKTYIINGGKPISKQENKYGERTINCSLSGGALIANGMASVGLSPFIVADASALSRCNEQLKSSALAQCDLTVVGLQSGVGGGMMGHSRMALDDIARFRAFPGSVVLCPADAGSLRSAMEIAANHRGVTQVRVPWDTEVVQDQQQNFQIGRCVVRKQSALDTISIIAVGSCLKQALAASELLQANNVSARVIDLFCAKPVDRDNLLFNATKTNHRVLVVEDHCGEGGAFEAITAALANTGISVHGLFITGVCCAGKPSELLSRYGLDAHGIQRKVSDIIANAWNTQPTNTTFEVQDDDEEEL